MAVQPPKFMQINMLDSTPYALWTQDDGSNDPWIGNPYQWTINCTVTIQTHSWNGSPTPFEYDGTNIAVGDWIATSSGGIAVQIVSISAQTQTSITCVVEDIDRWNTQNDPTQSGAGIGPTGPGYLFNLSPTGLPVVFPIDGYGLDDNFASDLTSRFLNRNDTANYQKVIQPNHGLAIGQAILMNSSAQYVAAIANQSVDNVVGIVTDSHTYSGDHSYDWFAYQPVGQIFTNLNLPGNPGDLIYVSSTVAGGFTNVAPAGYAKAMYIQLQNPQTGIFIDRTQVTPSSGGTAGTANSFTVTVTNTSPSTIMLGTVPAGSRIISATVTVTTPFSDHSATLTIGDSTNNTSIMDDNDNDLSSDCTYEEFPSVLVSVADVYNVYFNPKTSNSGSATVSISYV